jgi:hypothetical protein
MMEERIFLPHLLRRQKIGKNKTVKGKNYQHDENYHRHFGCFCCCWKVGKTVNKICIKKALTKSLVTFKLKGSRLLSKDWFPCRDKASVHTASSVQESKLRRRWQEDLPPFLFAGYRPGGPFFSVAE